MVTDDPLDHGKMARCPDCTDWLRLSRLTEVEQKYTVRDIKDRDDDTTGEPAALRHVAIQMLADPFGFFTVYGASGSAKSLVLCVLVAEFCRRGKESRYYGAEEITAGMRPSDNTDPASLSDRLKALPVLAIDELDKIKWTDYQIETVGGIIEHRYRRPEDLVTLLSMNRPPWEWRNSDQTVHILSRMRDGRFNTQWPDALSDFAPGCIADNRNVDGSFYVPGIFEVKLPDLRPTLRR